MLCAGTVIHAHVGMWTPTASGLDVYGQKLRAAYFCSLVVDVSHISRRVSEDRFTSESGTTSRTLKCVAQVFLL